MLIDRIYQKVKKFLNTDVRGNVTPEEFNLLLHDAIQARNEEYFYDLNRLVVRENRGMISNYIENLPDRIREKILHYSTEGVLESEETNIKNLPLDVLFIDEIENEDGATFEFCANKKTFNILKSVATIKYPIYTSAGNKIRISPEYDGEINITYLRKVKFPKWTFTIVSGTALFNPSASGFQDADIHASEENEMVKKVLLAFGVNLKEQDIQAFVNTQDNKELNKENA